MVNATKELFVFANLGGDGLADASVRSRIAASFGSFDAWESEFRKIAQGLGGGSGDTKRSDMLAALVVHE